ncbi:phage terminase large subunit [Paenibacillus sp. FSL K6-0108]|uniref:phage terminase large subunit n=1 Tax=Paenibacillus sp. FSL K6-0108 TaxID=2921417 RepID=UPI00324CD285
MAWVNDRWVDRDEREQIIDRLDALIHAMTAEGVPELLTSEEEAELAQYLDESKRLSRIHRAEADLLYFALEYFSEVHNPGNAGNWDGFDVESVEDSPSFHREICETMDDVSMREINAKVVRAAPRSHAKSSYLSKAFPLREIAYRHRKYIINISETPAVSTGNLEWIANQLKSNAKLRADFGPLLNPKQQMNPKDNSSEFVAWEPGPDGGQRQLTKMEAASSNQALRGRNWEGVRPDLIICDDLEDIRSNAATPELRQKMRDWFSQTVVPLGDPKGKRTAFVYMGTVVHAESLLRTVMKRSDFNSKLYKALIEDPEHTELWEKCRAIYLNPDVEDRVKLARAFYEANREEMDRGAVVLWPEVQPLWALMTWKWANGSKAFNTEYQNTPIDEESMIFNPELFRYYDESDLIDSFGRELPLDYYAFWDIAQGKSSRSDYNAIVTVGIDRNTRAMYVIDAWARKCAAHIALEQAVEIIKRYGHKAFAVETVGAQHDMYRQLSERLRKERIGSVRLKAVVSRTKKEIRIESLEPLIESGFLRFNKSHRLLHEQMEQFPSGTHDDLPDSLAGAVEAAGGGARRGRSWSKKPKGL